MASACVVAACGSAGPDQPASSPASTGPASTGPASTGPASTGPASPSGSAIPSGSTISPTAAAPGSTDAAGLATCHTAALVITVDDSQANGGAGSEYYPLDFTNTSVSPCEMYGFPGVSFVSVASAGGRQVGAAALRAAGYPDLTVRLAPGQSAHAWLKVAVAANFPASACKPTTVHWLRVYPPGETVAGYASQTFTACSSASATQLTVLPVRAGKGVMNVTP
jgi:hypothetical protein